MTDFTDHLRTDPDPVTPQELATFMRQLGAMLDAGVEVLRALRVATQQSGSPTLAAASQDVARLLGDGQEFHQALLTHPELFDPFCIEMARQGEHDGTLGRALLAVSDYLDHMPAPVPAAAALTSAPGLTTPPPPTAGVVLRTLGAGAVSLALLWGLSTAAPHLLPPEWLGPAAALAAGVCLLYGGSLLRGAAPSVPVQAVPEPPKLPPKSPERKQAETEAVVRNAVLEQDEARESAGLRES
jgi:hypothetical protein